MTVKELMAKLEEYPEDSVVGVLNEQGYSVTDIELYTSTSGQIDILPA